MALGSFFLCMLFTYFSNSSTAADKDEAVPEEEEEEEENGDEMKETRKPDTLFNTRGLCFVYESLS